MTSHCASVLNNFFAFSSLRRAIDFCSVMGSTKASHTQHSTDELAPIILFKHTKIARFEDLVGFPPWEVREQVAAMKVISRLKERLDWSGRQAAAPEGTVVYAIGDVHGRDELLENLLAQISAHASQHDADRRVIVFLGDYVDRGWQSKEVLERLSNLEMPGFEPVFLKGNHEEALLSFLDDPHFLESWRQYGGLETLHAYGLKDLNFRADEDYLHNVHSEFVTALPAHHRTFLLGLPSKYELGGYLFVHAGVRPGVPLEKQQEHDLRWIRDEFLNSRQDFGKRIVHGHCPEEDPQVRPNRIGIDTGAYITGVLTAAVLKGTNVSFLKTTA